MKQALTLQQAHIRTRHNTMAIALWSLQILLALLFFFTGSMKLLTPIEVLLAQMPLPLPALLVRFIGTAEVAGAFGLLLPGLLRIQRRLTPLAASGLIILMVGATIYNLMASLAGAAAMTAVLGLLALFIAYGRRSWVQTK